MKKGFTLIELLAVIVVLAIIATIVTLLVLNIIKSSAKGAMQSDARILLKAIDQRRILHPEFDPTDYNDNLEGLMNDLGINDANYKSIHFIYNDKTLLITVEGKGNYNGLIACGSYNDIKVSEEGCTIDLEAPIVTLKGDAEIEITQGETYTELGVTVMDNIDPNPIVVITGEVNTSIIGEYTLTYTVTDASGNSTSLTRIVRVVPISYDGPKYVESKEVNGPLLVEGMTPIKWNGSTWVDTNKYDVNWYDYSTSSKKWANARTADGSMWVWIPRYGYRVTTNYHSSAAGTIDVKFLINDTNISTDGITVIEGSDSKDYYVKHPSFDFGGTEITGIWVAKFEASGIASSLGFKSGIQSLRDMTVSDMFTATRNMETNNIYGWDLASGLKASGIFTTDTNDIDTHMLRNSEWGAIAYISKSAYGINDKIKYNDSSDFYTGGGVGNAYVANVNQSSTGNVYGIYDISGGSHEYVMACFNNTTGSSGLTPNLIDNKYIDRYSSANNGYSNAKYGDAMYETSDNPYIGSSGNSYGSWHTNNAVMFDATYPWLSRGDFYNNSSAGAFTFNRQTGASSYAISFRVAIVSGIGF